MTEKEELRAAIRILEKKIEVHEDIFKRLANAWESGQIKTNYGLESAVWLRVLNAARGEG